MYEMIEKQGSTPASSDAVLTKAMLDDRKRSLTDIIRPIQNKPKPQPKKEEKKEEEKEPEKKEGEESGEKGTEGGADKMEDGADEKNGEAAPEAEDNKDEGPIPMDVD